jgi:hypothetical protein
MVAGRKIPDLKVWIGKDGVAQDVSAKGAVTPQLAESPRALLPANAGASERVKEEPVPTPPAPGFTGIYKINSGSGFASLGSGTQRLSTCLVKVLTIVSTAALMAATSTAVIRGSKLRKIRWCLLNLAPRRQSCN